MSWKKGLSRIKDNDHDAGMDLIYMDHGDDRKKTLQLLKTILERFEISRIFCVSLHCKETQEHYGENSLLSDRVVHHLKHTGYIAAGVDAESSREFREEIVLIKALLAYASLTSQNRSDLLLVIGKNHDCKKHELINNFSQQKDFPEGEQGTKADLLSNLSWYLVSKKALPDLLDSALPVGQNQLSSYLNRYCKVSENETKAFSKRKGTKIQESVVEESKSLRGSKFAKLQKTFRFNEDRKLGFVACYFNPCHFRSRYLNTLEFMKQVYLPNLIMVELAFGDEEWQLPDNTPNLVRVRSRSVLWHKEALINLGLKLLLKEGFDHVGWLDADVIFETPNWQEACLEALKTQKLCQVFETAHVEFPDIGSLLLYGASRRINEVQETPKSCSVAGFGWAMHREVAESCQLYDANVIGGADSLLWRGIFFDQYPLHQLISKKEALTSLHNRHRKRWMRKWCKIIGGRLGYAQGVRVRTLGHGRYLDRNYSSRNLLLLKSQFNPTKHLIRNYWGGWEWNKGLVSSELIEEIKQYFHARQEDLE